jgi:hypothetical protein
LGLSITEEASGKSFGIVESDRPETKMKSLSGNSLRYLLKEPVSLPEYGIPLDTQNLAIPSVETRLQFVESVIVAAWFD